MRALIIGAGGVGAAAAAVARGRPFLERLVVADVDVARAERAAAGDDRFVAAQVDASDEAAIVALARSERVDAILNACDPRFNPPIFAAAFAAGCTYLDMAMTLSEPGVLLGERQLADAVRWEETGRLALVGIGVEPGLSDVFARYAADELFAEIDEVGVRDGADLVVEGYDFAPTFSIWTTIEECLNPPVIWEAERGWYTTVPAQVLPCIRSPSVAGSGSAAATTSLGATSTPFTRIVSFESSPSLCRVLSTSMNSWPSPYLKVTRRQSSARGTRTTSSCSTLTHSTGPIPSGKSNTSGSENGSVVYQPRSRSQITGGFRHSSIVVQIEKVGAKS